jgi:hypothetical protein
VHFGGCHGVFGGLIYNTILSRIIIFEINGVNLFQKVKTCVTIQLKDQYAPFMNI